MFRTEQGQIIPPSEISSFREGPSRVGVALEKVPQLVEEIEINPRAAEFLSDDYKYLASPDFWLKRAVLTVPFADGRIGRMSPRLWGRAVPIGYGRIPYGNFVGGSLTMKGVFRAGLYYTDKYDDFRSSRAMPIGFFGRPDSRKEQMVGNELLDMGVRSSLVIATLTFDLKKMRTFLRKRWKDYPVIKKDIGDCLDRFEEGNESPAVIGRLGGVLARREWLRQFWNDDYLGSRGELIWASSLWLSEAKLFPDHFRHYLTGLNVSLSEVVRMLTRVIERKKLNKAEFVTYIKLNAGILGNNARRLRIGVEKSPVLRPYQNLGRVLTQNKDLCLALIAQDYEEFMEELDPFLLEKPNTPWSDYVGRIGSLLEWRDGYMATALLAGGKESFDDELRALVHWSFSTELLRLGWLDTY